MPEYVLTVGGPSPLTRYITADDDNGAIGLMRAEIAAEFPEPTDDEKAALIALTCAADGTNYTGVLGQAFEDPPFS